MHSCVVAGGLEVAGFRAVGVEVQGLLEEEFGLFGVAGAALEHGEIEDGGGLAGVVGGYGLQVGDGGRGVAGLGLENG